MSDVVIKQDLTWRNRPWSPNGCSPPPSVRWMECKTNHVLQERGLNQDILDQEIKTLNKKANAFKQTHNYHYWCCLIPVLILAALVGCIINKKPFVIAILIIGVAALSFLICSGILWHHESKWKDCLSHIRNYIENELNPRYRAAHISWEINSRHIEYKIMICSDHSFIIRYDDIVITPYLESDLHEIMVNKMAAHATNNEERKLILLMAGKEVVVEEVDDIDIEGNDTKINLKIDSQEKVNEMKSMCIQDGYYKFGCFGMNKVIEVTDNSKRIGAVLQQYDEKGSDNQIFYVEKKDGDYCTIRCKHSGLYWNFVGASKDNNRNVTQWNYHGLENQQFKFVNKDNGNFNIIARHSDKALTVENGLHKNGAKIVQRDVNDASHQLFHCTLVV